MADKEMAANLGSTSEKFVERGGNTVLDIFGKINPLERAEFDWCWPSTVYSVLAQKSQPDFTNQCPFVSDILKMAMAGQQTSST